MATSPAQVISMTAVAFWLFIGAEFAIPISGQVKNAKKNVPLGMALGLIIILIMQSIMVLGFYHYTPWNDLANSAAPHMLYGELLLGKAGKIWMALVAALAVISTQNSGVNGLAYIGQGMAKMNMLPQIFAKTNKKRVAVHGAEQLHGRIDRFVRADGVHVDADLLPGVEVADKTVAGRFGAGAGDLVAAGLAVADRAGLAVRPDAGACAVENLFVLHEGTSVYLFLY